MHTPAARLALAVGLACTCVILPSAPLAQEPATAAYVATAFYRAIGARRWQQVAGHVHPDRLAIVRSHLVAMLDADTTGVVRARLLDLPDRAAFQRASDAEVMERVLHALEREVPSLAAVLATNEVRVLGIVPDGENTAHAVVRVTPWADGPRPSWVRVTTLRRHRGSWAVYEAEELNSILTAVLGLPLKRRP